VATTKTIGVIIGIAVIATIICASLYMEWSRLTPSPTLSTMKYPLKVSENKRYLVDQRDVPFLLQGDAPWSLIVGLTKEEAELYLKNRSQKGFNTLMVNLIDHKYCKNPPKNAYGEKPFTTPGDFSTPNEKYFAHSDWIIRKASEYGIQLLLDPIYLGYKGGNDGWFQEVLAAGPEKCLEYGRYLGKRYADFDNIIWLMGGDRNPGPALDYVNIVAQGIKEYDKRHLFTAHGEPESSAAIDYSGCEWLDINSVYSYKTVHLLLLFEYDRIPVMPSFLIESTYEGEHNSDPVQIRRQAYWSILCGGLGHVFGNRPIWLFDSGWQAAMNSPGSIDMMRWGKLFNSIKWYELVPDQKHTVVREKLDGLQGLDYLSSACTADGSTVIAYMYSPTYMFRSRTIIVDMSTITGSMARAWWFDPATGNATSIGEFPTKGSREFTSPNKGDWVLILNDASKNLPLPKV
jgi:hypothetical protein